MSIHVALHHMTQYEYDRPVALSPHVFRLRPAAHSRTAIESYSLRIEPAQHYINWQQDPFGNYLARVVFPEKARLLRIEVDLVADMTVFNPFDFFLDGVAEQYPFAYDEPLRRDLTPYFEIVEAGPLLTQWLTGVPRGPGETVPFLADLNRRLYGDIRYNVRLEPGVQTCEETLGKGLGSCRDSGWLLVQILRHLGLAARFVSGYLVQLTADEKSLDGPSGPEQDFTDLHAWAEVYLPGAGWVGLDPTSGLVAGEGHIPLACTPSPQSAAPVTGATEPCSTQFSFANKVTRVREDPRVTKPYTDAHWSHVERLGRRPSATKNPCTNAHRWSGNRPWRRRAGHRGPPHPTVKPCTPPSALNHAMATCTCSCRPCHNPAPATGHCGAGSGRRRAWPSVAGARWQEGDPTGAEPFEPAREQRSSKASQPPSYGRFVVIALVLVGAFYAFQEGAIWVALIGAIVWLWIKRPGFRIAFKVVVVCAVLGGIGTYLYVEVWSTRVIPLREVWGLTVGMKKSEVLFRKGEPNIGEGKGLGYNDGGVYYHLQVGDDGNLTSISVVGDPYPYGFSSSTTTEQARSRLGAPSRQFDSEDGLTRWLQYPELHANFAFEKNRLWGYRID